MTIDIKNILYLAAGRSVSAKDPGRKISSILRCWRADGHCVQAVFGKDNEGPNQTPTSSTSSQFGHQQYYNKWYREVSVAKPLVHTASEWRDIKHDQAILQYVSGVVHEFKPDLIWERSYRLISPGWNIARQNKVPYVLEWKDHLVDYDLSLFRGRALKLEALKNQEADYIVVESGVLRDSLAREGVDPDKILISHNAVDVTEFSKNETDRMQVRAELGIDDDVVLVGYLGSYAFYHDAPRLVQATALISEQRLNRQIKVLMVGAGKEYPESRALAEELDLLDETLLMLPGVPKDRVPGILSALDIAVLPGSTDIICPIKVQEYMASMLPTVAPDYACNREVLHDGVTGELFAPKDAEALANKILLLARDDALRLRMGHQARRDAAKRFSWQATWGAALASILEETAS